MDEIILISDNPRSFIKAKFIKDDITYSLERKKKRQIETAKIKQQLS